MLQDDRSDADFSLIKMLEWHRSDFEQRIGFGGAKYTDVNIWCALVITAVLCGIVFAGLIFLPPELRKARVVVLVLDRGWTPYAMTVCAFFALVILFIKSRKLAFQMKALDIEIIPQANDFSLTPETAQDALKRMYGLVDDTKRIVLFNRIERALMNLKNIGNVSDVSEMLRAQAENDENLMESSYSLLRGLIWSIPIFGFIGTVVGLSGAIGAFGAVLSTNANVGALKESLTPVTSNLSVAFDTTFLALMLAITVQMIMTMIQKREETFLDNCRDYAHCHVVSRLRLTKQ
jgi:biopolymer transport protein ExbB/TolQ